MDWHNHIPTYSPELIGQVILLQAQPGQSRRNRLKQWLKEAQQSGADTWFLSCDRDEGGPWAGLRELLNNLVPKMQADAPDLINQNYFELAKVLPSLRQTTSGGNPALTDKALHHEQVHGYPGDRVFRTIHRLIDLLGAWYQRSDSSPQVIACDHYDRASALVSRFFAELMRRRGQQLNLTLLIAVDLGASDAPASQFDPKYLEQCVQLNLPFSPAPLINKQQMARLAQELAQHVEKDAIKQQLHLPQIIHHWLHSDQPENAFTYQIQALSIYTAQGLYEDALVYGEAALTQLERHCPDDIQKGWSIYSKLHNCYLMQGKPAQALQVIEAAMARTDDSSHLFHCCYRMAMLYARYLPERDLIKAEAYLERGMEELTRSDWPEHAKVAQTVVNRNGLALLYYRQGHPHKALELCKWCYEQLNTRLLPEQYRLLRSTLLYNIAQVLIAIGSYKEAITRLTSAIAMDPYYSEYYNFYNDRGNTYLKMGCLDNALSDYLKDIELSSPYPEVWTNLGQCYRLMGRMTDAIDAYSTSLDLDPNQSLALVGRAQAFEMLEKPEAALADYSAALILNPNQPLILANRAILHYDAGRYQEALADLDNAIALAPDTPNLYQNRAVAFTVLGRLEEAARDLQTYLQLSPHAEDRFEVESQLLALQASLVNFTSC